VHSGEPKLKSEYQTTYIALEHRKSTETIYGIENNVLQLSSKQQKWHFTKHISLQTYTFIILVFYRTEQ